MHTDQQALALLGELVALYGTDLDLTVEHRAANLQRTKVVTEQYQVQPRRFQVQRRRFLPGFELALWRGTFITRPDSNVVTLDQRLQAGDTGQGDGRLDHPELGAVDQVVFGQWVQGQFGDGTGKVSIDFKGFQRADLNAFVHHRRTPGLQPLEVAQLDLDLDTRLGSIEVFEQAERQVRIGWRAVLAVLRCSKGNTAGNDAGQRLTAHFHPGQVGIDTDATGVPEARVLAHQAGVGRLDEDFDFHCALVFGQAVAFHLTDLDLLVEHRAVAVERTQSICLERQVQARLAIRQWRCFVQRFETFAWLSRTWAHGNVITRYQSLQTGDASQRDTRLDQPEACAAIEVRLSFLVHFNGGNNTGVVAFGIQHQLFHLTYRHAFEDHLGFVDNNALTTFKANLNVHP
ncbi:hypothetical protein D3C79_597500 [compost metagenome]